MMGHVCPPAVHLLALVPVLDLQVLVPIVPALALQVPVQDQVVVLPHVVLVILPHSKN